MNALARIQEETQHESLGELMPRATIETLVRLRNETLNKYGLAHDALMAASGAIGAAASGLMAVTKRETAFNYHSRRDRGSIVNKIDVAERDAYMAEARKIVDTEVWSHVIEITDLERLMDKEAKEKLQQQLLAEPPEVTVENVRATLEQFALDAGTIFRRGIANAFSRLDRRFRSHDGFKIGSRMILDRMFGEDGHFNYHRDMESTLMDVERAFMVIEGSSVPASYAGIVGKLRNHRSNVWGARQSEVEDEFFLLRVFKNGNCHVWFKRDDLLEKVNKLLAEYYGEAVGDGMTPEDDGGLFDPKTSLAKNYGFFPTPQGATAKLIEATPLYREEGAPALTVLEPSAGTGNLAWALASRNIGKKARELEVDCVEVHRERFAALNRKGAYRRVYHVDFLALRPTTTGLYDRVVMNPPFDRERDIDHVMHALEFLKPDGFLAAIMSAGTEFRETRKAVAFRELMKKMNARFSDLPAGSFSSVGTNVNTIMLRVYKSGQSFWQ